jgi:hypothetical protein
MAAPLGQVVFKVPELGQQGYQLEVQKQAREEKKRQQRESDVYKTGGERAYNDNIYKLQGRHKQAVELLYSEYERLSTEYEMTGSEKSLREAQRYSNMMKSRIQEYQTQVGIPLKNASSADQVGWEGYVGDRASFDEQMNQITAPVEQKIVNGTHMIKVDGEFVPYDESPYASDTPNQYNTVMVQKASKLGTYVVPSAWEMENRSIGLYAGEDATRIALEKFTYELESDPELKYDVAMAYAISKGVAYGLPEDPKKIPVKTVNEIQRRYDSDPAFQKEAKKFYTDRITELVSNREKYSKKQDLFDGVDGGQEATKPASSSVEPTEEDPMGLGIFEKPSDTPEPKKKVATKYPTLRGELKEEDIQDFIDSKSNGKSPLSAKDYVEVAAKYDVPVDLLLAQGALESNFATKGMGVSTKNVGNVGNNGNTGKKTYMDSYRDGLEKMASLLSRRYRPKNNDWNSLLGNFVNDKGYRYAEEEGYEDAVSGLVAELYT